MTGSVELLAVREGCTVVSSSGLLHINGQQSGIYPAICANFCPETSDLLAVGIDPKSVVVLRRREKQSPFERLVEL